MTKPEAPPTPGSPAPAVAYISDFSVDPPKGWLPTGGSWSCVDGSYRHTSANGIDLSIYGGASWVDFTFAVDVFPRYDNPYGVVFAYQDPKNHCGVSIKGAEATLFRMTNGVMTPCGKAMCTGTAKWKWSTVTVTRAGRTATVAVNGHTILAAVEIGEPAAGRIGLLTEWSQVDFTKITVTAPNK